MHGPTVKALLVDGLSKLHFVQEQYHKGFEVYS